jgi:hypothetical protein
MEREINWKVLALFLLNSGQLKIKYQSARNFISSEGKACSSETAMSALA